MVSDTMSAWACPLRVLVRASPCTAVRGTHGNCRPDCPQHTQLQLSINLIYLFMSVYSHQQPTHAAWQLGSF